MVGHSQLLFCNTLFFIQPINFFTTYKFKNKIETIHPQIFEEIVSLYSNSLVRTKKLKRSCRSFLQIILKIGFPQT